MRIIAISNQKGGVGKTTTTINLGAAIHELGHRVLMIDLDPQSSLTTALGLADDDPGETIYEVLQGVLNETHSPSLRDVASPTGAGPDLVPATLTLSAAELDLMQAIGGEFALRDAIQHMGSGAYDVVLIDCLPSLGLLTINALAAADEVLIPLQAQYLPMKALQLLLGTVGKAQRKLNPNLTISGIVLTMVDMQTVHQRQVVDNIQQIFKGREDIRVFETQIKKAVAVQESSVVGESMLTYAPTHPVSEAYRQLAREVLS